MKKIIYNNFRNGTTNLSTEYRQNTLARWLDQKSVLSFAKKYFFFRIINLFSLPIQLLRRQKLTSKGEISWVTIICTENENKKNN